MKLKLTKGTAATSDDIAALQRKIGEPVVSDFLEFVAENDGAEPEINIFKIGAANESGVDGFIPVREIVSEIAHLENLPAKAFPVAWAACGNYVFIDQADNGAVFFWDHEEPHHPVKLANGFRSFLESLEPFDISSINLKPGQVRKAWIDPDFLKGIQE